MASAVVMKDIVKRFPAVLANDHITLEVEQGEIHGLLGENGAGKTTLMNILYGLCHADSGEIWLRGQRSQISSPHEAIAQGIGMVHQHFMLIPPFTVAENLILGAETSRRGFLDRHAAAGIVTEISQRYQLRVDPLARVQDISIGMQQRVEILKAIYRRADILILDEPTAVLTPQEVRELYEVMNNLKKEGHTIIFITHKLNEALTVADRITVLRDGRVVGTVRPAQTNEKQLARMMVGRDVLLQVEKPAVQSGPVALKVENLHAVDNRGLPAVRGVSFEIRFGEIIGLAGIAGNGQTELVEVLTGLRKSTAGRIFVDGREVTGLSPQQLFQAGIAHIPEDRHRRGLILDFSLMENFILGFQDDPPFAGRVALDYVNATEFADRLIKTFDIRTPGYAVAARSLSGGNQQKVILAREFQRSPKVLIAAQPTRGLDIGATEFVHQRLVEQQLQGRAVLLVSLELSEILDLSTRILVMYEGQIVGSCSAGEATEEQLGLWMAGVSAEMVQEARADG
ncbi:MAG: ABC transporter ATP-binding protein [Chloroflexi bacterium]|nr:ABC transporter ATP-binding protein [Chloroflexota bacterium]